jgi:8-hydroxy-5-deazaflavin:NADPH oxidoreductase
VAAWGPFEQEQQVTDTVGILGGTGGLGKGLAARWVRAGIPVILGSRSPERAANAAQEVAGWLEGEDHAELRGEGNAGAAAADLVIASVPFDGLAEGLEPLTAALAGKVVVSVVNPLGFDQRGAHPLPVAEGSAAEAVEALLPGARVTAAFHSVSSVALRQLGQPMDDDVPVSGTTRRRWRGRSRSPTGSTASGPSRRDRCVSPRRSRPSPRC